jgi:acetaldehyde/propanal dehydrogenase
MDDRLGVLIIGSGNIGTDLMAKVGRSPSLELVGVAGIDPDSPGLARAAAAGVATSHQGLEELLGRVSDVDLAFDATSASAHPAHAELLKERGIVSIDLTPAALGPPVIPAVNLDQHLGAPDMNLVTCGAQATAPVVAAIARVADLPYAEIVSSISARSAGPGTRANIDEFTQSTARSLELVGGAGRGKAIIILNPAEPPLIMRDTIHCLTAGEPAREAITASVRAMVREVQGYVPGYTLKNGPIFDGRRVTIFVEVMGLGDYLPPYAGNLDIMTAAALRTGEVWAELAPGGAS